MRLLPDGEVSHVITIGQDVTEQRQMERAMAQTEKMAAIGRLVAGIAHEINNPLATIAGCAESMRARLGESMAEEELADFREDSQLIEDEAYRCKRILQNLLDFARTEPEQGRGCDPAAVVRRTLQLVKHNPKMSTVSFAVEVDDDLPQLLASADHLVQVLLALIVNAADAAPEGCITLCARTMRTEGGSEVVISVEDDGPGIPRDLQGRVFEPFFTTKPPGQGTGLGLAVAYGLIQVHEGRLEMSSEPGQGTRFEVILPAYAELAMER